MDSIADLCSRYDKYIPIEPGVSIAVQVIKHL